jgi:predicted PurR-regulated permease PerM
MASEDRIEIRFPKGITSKDLAIIVIFGIFISLMLWTLQNVFTSGFQNPNYAIIVIALILIAICLIMVYVIRVVSRGEKATTTSSNS